MDESRRFTVLRFAVLIVLAGALGFATVLESVAASKWLHLGTDFRPEVQLPLLLIQGLIALVIALATLVAAFHLFGLTDRTKPFGVPEGTLQVVIALTLILIFAISSLYLRGSFNPEKVKLEALTASQADEIPADQIVGKVSVVGGRFDVIRQVPVDQDAKDFSNQLLTILGTLVGAVAGFYFGAKSVETGVSAGERVQPTNTIPPDVKGLAHVGARLRAEPGTWTGSPTPSYGYQWQRRPRGAADWSDVPGANAQSYLVVPDDAGATLRVAVTATNTAGAQTAHSPETDEVAQAPSNTAPPGIVGDTSEGAVLTASPGTWSAVPAPSYGYQWERSDPTRDVWAPIPQANAFAYQVMRDDVGKRLRVSVTATNPAGESSAASLPTEPVSGAPVNTVPPTVEGDPRAGFILTADPGQWTGWPLSFSYQWRRASPAEEDWKPIKGARESTYQLTSEDVGTRVQIQVSVSGVRASSSPTSVISAAPEEPTP